MRQINFKIILLILIWVIAAVITGIFDLQISQSVVNNSPWAKFLQDYGMIPGIIVLLLGIYVYYYYLLVKKTRLLILKQGFFFLAGNLLIFYLLDVLITNITNNDKALSDYFSWISAGSICINLVVVTTLHFKKFKLSDTAIIFSKIIIAVGFWGYVICIQLVKTVWGRVRFRDLDKLFSNFTPWYLPQGITGFDSFPSGHAAMGWLILPLMVTIVNKKRLVKFSVLTLICFWGTALAVSRVIIGAHYVSDVLFGSFLIIFTFYFTRKYYLTRNENF